MSFTGMTPEQGEIYKKSLLSKGGRVNDQNTDRDCWTTPGNIVRDAQTLLNITFQIDAAATKNNAKCPLYFGPDHEDPRVRDALLCDWIDFAMLWEVEPIIWLNPPYSTVGKFVEKAYEESRQGATIAALVGPSLSSKWWNRFVLPVITPEGEDVPTFQNLLRPPNERIKGEGRGRIINFEKRIQFDPPQGIQPSTNSRDSVLIIFSPSR